MELTPLLPEPGSYAQGALVSDPTRWLYISGQVPETELDGIPEDFESQCRLAWRNVQGVLDAAGMTVANLVKVTVFLSDRRYREVNAKIRQEVLGVHRPALTIIITGIWDEAWLLEIEGVAAG